MPPAARPSPAGGAASPCWPDLPFDLVRDISGRLHTAGDYVRFHAVCTSWRDTLPPPPCRPAFLPWLLAPPRDAATGHPTARCVFSPRSSRRAAVIKVPDLQNGRWVIGADHGGSWLLAVSPESGSASLVNPLTGSPVATPQLPPLHDEIWPWVRRAVGVVSGDGTVFLHAFSDYYRYYHMPILTALLRPGDPAWTSVPQDGHHLSVLGSDIGTTCVAYIDGNIVLCCSSNDSWDIVRTDRHQPRRRRGYMPDQPNRKSQSIYTVESRGELLGLVVQLKTDSAYYKDIFFQDHCYGTGDVGGLAGALSVSVYALEDADGDEPRWERRDGRSVLADRVLFLGRPSSFAVDAAPLGVAGGCAYFVDRRTLYGGAWSKTPLQRCRVFRYSFVDGTVEFIEQLPPEWIGEGFMWITPQPAIASTEEIRERVEAVDRKAEKHQWKFGADFRIYVGNLPRKVDSYRLRQFFSKHGKVSEARVMCSKGSSRSRGFGFVTMAIAVDDDPSDAIAKLQGQNLDGRPLRVKFADQDQ